jgi:signal peptidase II
MQQILKYTFLIIIILVGFITDQASKRWAAFHIKDKPVYVVVNNVLELGYTENHGMVFGINNRNSGAHSKSILLTIRILLSIGLIIYIVINRKKSLFFHFPFLLILSGALGNVYDSLRYGHVIDFIHMHIGTLIDWPFLYNLADAYVCIGMGILVIQTFIFDNKKNKQILTKS